MQWQTPLIYVKGVGPQRAEWLKKELQLETVKDLLLYFPFRYNDKTLFYTISELEQRDEFVQTRGKITGLQIHGTGAKKRLHAELTDSTGSMELIWFKGIKWMEQRLKIGTAWIVFGKPNRFKNQLSMAHPELTIADELKAFQGEHFDPVYSSTESLKTKGLDSNGIKRLIRQVLQGMDATWPDPFPAAICQRLQCVSRYQALLQIHFPKHQQDLEAARLRLKAEELLALQLRVLRIKTKAKFLKPAYPMPAIGHLFSQFYNTLGFELTTAQKRAIKEIHNDLKLDTPMNRLLQGDVGSGKTIVAVMAAIIAHANSYQTCIMVPTEILAQQHFNSISALLSPLQIHTDILTGSTPTKTRQALFKKLSEGQIHVLVGTHALIEDGIPFLKLGLVIIDEQHRFGVAQRAKLTERSGTHLPHVLVMTATPIPRTLAMTVYGDLDTTLLDELPAGRKPIVTKHAKESQRLAVWGFLRSQIEMGHQIYVVFPLIAESETLDYQNLQQGYDALVQEFPPPLFQISIVHGKLTNEQKALEMNRFVNGETQIMVATTVIEVGVNVPNASVMVIESAERFGLAQLHQLRGRVGRGNTQSYCILMTGLKLSQEARYRMQALVQSQNGFEISELDLKLRGPGNLEGTEQSGLLQLRLTQLAEDTMLIADIRAFAMEIMQSQPPLFNTHMEQLLQDYAAHKNDYSRIA